MKDPFSGLPSEYAATHLNNFADLCDLQKKKYVDNDIVKLKLFPFSLRDRAKAWFSSLPKNSIDFTRFSIGKRGNRSAKKIIIVGIGEVTQFGIILSHRDKQAIQHTSKQEAREKEANGKDRANKTARVKWGRGKRKANGK